MDTKLITFYGDLLEKLAKYEITFRVEPYPGRGLSISSGTTARAVYAVVLPGPRGGEYHVFLPHDQRICTAAAEAAEYIATGLDEAHRRMVWDKLLTLAAELPSGLDDPKAVEKLVREHEEFIAALNNGDDIGALLEAADIIYYAAKILDRIARQLRVTPGKIISAAIAKYEWRAQPGNPKDDTIERVRCARAVGWEE